MSKAIVVSNKGLGQAEFKEVMLPELKENEVLIKSYYSSINYKDALAVTGQGKILRNFPLIPGIDVCGEVIKSNSQKYTIGDVVLQTGGNLGEVYNGGLSEQVVLRDSNCIMLPKGLTAKESMILGTAGFTAALAVDRMEINSLSNEYPIVVTGASGGVGNFSVQILKSRGYFVTAVSSKKTAIDWLKKLGADQVLEPEDVLSDKSMDSVKWSGAIDNLGGDMLKSLLASTDLYGQVASVGLAQSFKLDTTVMPFILRGVNLIGVSSNNCPMPWRKKIWKNLSGEGKPQHLQEQHLIGLKDVIEFSNKLIGRKITGRILVKF